MSPTSTVGNTQSSMEAIAFQGKSGLFRDLTQLMEQCASKRIRDPKEFSALNLGEVVSRHTGLAIQFKLEPDLASINAMAMPVILDGNSPLLQMAKELGLSALVDTQTVTHEKILPVCRTMRGSIDLGRSRVTGVLTKVPTEIYVGAGLWTETNMSAAEIAAVILHEIGHVFTYFEMLLYTTTANITLLNAKRDINRMPNQEERIKLVFEVAEFMQVKLDDAESLADPKLDPSKFQAIFLAARGSQVPITAAGSNLYDMRSSEVVADQFAARHGAGRDMVTGLAKIYRYAVPETQTTLFAHAIGELIKIFRLAIMPVVLALFHPALGVVMLIAVATGWLGYLTLANPEFKIYDDPRERLDRIRKDLIQSLKSVRYDRHTREELVRDIEDIADLSKAFHDHRTFANFLWIYVGSARRRSFKQMRFEQELEKIVNNEIFVKASQLQSLV